MESHGKNESNKSNISPPRKLIWSFVIGFTPLLTLVFFLIRIFWNTSLIFEQIILSGVLVVIGYLSILMYTRYANIILILLIFLIASTATQVFTNVVLNIDRSRSFYLLSWVRYEKIEVVNGKLDLENVRSSEKLNPEAISQRLAEQVSRGLVSNDGKFELTFRGKMIVQFSDFIGSKFSLKGWEMNNR
jgi:hypothetical protein